MSQDDIVEKGYKQILDAIDKRPWLPRLLGHLLGILFVISLFFASAVVIGLWIKLIVLVWKW